MRLSFWLTYTHFNPHHREGGDSGMMQNGTCSIHFNPHHREGGDHWLPPQYSNTCISIHTTAKVVTAKTSNFPLMFLYKNTNFLIIMIIKSLPSTSCYIIHLLFDTFLGANDPRFLCQLGIRTKKSNSNQPQFPYPHQNVPL